MGQANVLMFVNCESRGWVTEKPLHEMGASPLARESGSGEGCIWLRREFNYGTPHLCPLPFGRGEATLRTADRGGRRLSVGLRMLLK